MAKPDKKDPKKPTTATRAPEPTTQSAESESLVASRFALPLDKDGKLLIDTMRPTSRDKLRELFTDPSIAKALNITQDVADGTTQIPPVLLYPLVNSLSMLDVLLVSRVTRAPREIIDRIVPYSRDEANQIATALGPVLGKYGTSFLSKYGEEVALLAVLSMTTMSKIAAVRDEMEKLGPREVVSPLPFIPPDRKDDDEPKGDA